MSHIVAPGELRCVHYYYVVSATPVFQVEHASGRHAAFARGEDGAPAGESHWLSAEGAPSAGPEPHAGGGPAPGFFHVSSQIRHGYLQILLILVNVEK